MSRSWFYLTFESGLPDGKHKTRIKALVEEVTCMGSVIHEKTEIVHEVGDNRSQMVVCVTDRSDFDVVVDKKDRLGVVVNNESEVTHIVK